MLIEQKFAARKPYHSYVMLILAAVLSVSIIRWIPQLLFLYAFPLLLVYFTRGNKTFMQSVLIALGLGIMLSFFFDGSFFLLNSALYGTFLLPLLWLDTRLVKRMRMRYRVVLVGISVALFSLPILQYLLTDVDIITVIRDMLNEMLAVVNGSSGQIISSADIDSMLVYVITMTVNLYTISFVFSYALVWRFALWCFSLVNPHIKESVSLASFYNDKFLLIPSACSTIGIVMGIALNNSPLSIISWNIASVCIFFYATQGCGIVLFFLRRFSFGIIGQILCVALFLFFPSVVLCFLSLLALLEYWIPIRRRTERDE